MAAQSGFDTSKSPVSREFSRILLNFTSRSRSQGILISILEKSENKSFHFSFLEKNKTRFLHFSFLGKKWKHFSFHSFFQEKVWNCAWNFAFCHENSTFWSFITLNCNIWNVDCLFEKVWSRDWIPCLHGYNFMLKHRKNCECCPNKWYKAYWSQTEQVLNWKTLLYHGLSAEGAKAGVEAP